MTRKELEMKTTDRKPRIVVGVDGSAESRQALELAVRLAPAHGAEIEAVAVWHWPVFDFAPLEGEDFIPPAEARIRRLVQDVVDATFDGETPPNMHILIREGHPAEQLVSRAEKAAMVIVGSRGRSGLKGRLQGSVSRYVSEHATCPVVIVHGSDDVNALV
jgi:nucleotide-binding universal stress UspA family protein